MNKVTLPTYLLSSQQILVGFYINYAELVDINVFCVGLLWRVSRY